MIAFVGVFLIYLALIKGILYDIRYNTETWVLTVLLALIFTFLGLMP
jgi:hypothetical protein